MSRGSTTKGWIASTLTPEELVLAMGGTVFCLLVAYWRRHATCRPVGGYGVLSNRYRAAEPHTLAWLARTKDHPVAQ